MSKIKTSLLALGLLLVLATTVSTLSPLFSKVAEAQLSDAQRQECYNTYNGKRISELTAIQALGQLYKTCVANSDASCTKPAGPNDIIKCEDPQAEAAALNANIEQTKVAPLIKLVCGDVPLSPPAVEAYTKCSESVRSAYDSCADTAYEEDGNDDEIFTALAGCATPKLNQISGGKKVNAGQVKTALAQGAKTADDQANEAGTAKSKKECEAANGTWENDKCTPAAEEAGPVCSGGMLGWVLCPLADLAVNVTNFFAEWTAKFLTFTPLLASDQGKAIQAVWQLLVNLANILLVVAFLFVVFSQATSVGLTSYGIKKMLPKIVAAAILMNLSFFLCAAAVDISNILGQSVAGIIQVGMNALPDPGTGLASELRKASDSPISGGAFAGAAGVLLGVTLVATGQIFAVLPVVIAAATVMFTAFLIILFRQVAIVILIIIAPLAFVAWVLPNTESWFTKWRKLFVSLLLMFPLIMGIFYGAAFLSNIMMLTLDPTKTGIEEATVQVAAIAVLFAPLFALPFVMKAVGGILDRFGIAANNRQKGLIDRSRKFANENGFKKHKDQKRLDRKARVATGNYRGAGGFVNPNNWRSSINRGMNRSAVFNTTTGGYGAQRQIAAQVQSRKDSEEAMRMFGNDEDLMWQWAKSGGDLSKVPANELNDIQKQQFTLMRQAGHHNKNTSFLAVADYMADNGKGDFDTYQEALNSASAAGADKSVIGNQAMESQAKFRGAGRGDMVGKITAQLNANKDSNGNIDPTLAFGDRGAKAATQSDINAQMTQAWNQVTPGKTHRDSFSQGFLIKDPATGNMVAKSDAQLAADDANEEIAYRSWLKSAPTASENTRAALVDYDSMESRAKKKVMQELIDAARFHEGAGSTISSIQDAKAYYKLR